jgi:hypothetical protein
MAMSQEIPARYEVPAVTTISSFARICDWQRKKTPGKKVLE